MLLLRKALRELVRQKAQTAVLLLVQVLGVALYVACYGGYLDLRDSYARSREALGLAQVHADVRGVDEQQVDAARAVHGVARAEGRLRVSLPVDLPEGRVTETQQGRVTIEGRFLSLPDTGEPLLDRVHVGEGRLPEAGEVLLERHLAEWHRLHAGDRVVVWTGAGRTSLTVAGIGSSPEYLWVWRSAQDPMPMPSAFGVMWVRRAQLVELVQPLAAQLGGRAQGDLAAASAGLDDQLLYDRIPGADKRAVDAAVAAAVGGGVLGTTEAEDLVGPRLLQLDIDGFHTMAYAFPVFFLVVAAFISLAGLARTVDAQREIIGTFLALGMPRRRVLGHYAALSIATGVVSSIVGAIAGQALAGQIATEYAKELHIPFVTTTFHAEVVALAITAGILTAAFAGILPAMRAARLAPAAAMRPPAPTAGWLVRASRNLGPLPLPARLAVRNLLRHPLRSLGTGIGVAAAVLLVAATGAVAVSTQRVADVQLLDARAYDLRVDLGAPAAGLGPTLAAMSSVVRAERSLTLPVTMRANGETRALVLSGVADDARLLRPVDWDGEAIRPEGDRVLLPRTEAARLGVTVGDAIELDSGDGILHPVRVGGLVDTAFGPVATMRLGAMQALFGFPGTENTVVATTSDAMATRATLMALPGAVGITDAAELRAQLDTVLALNLAMVGMMLVFATILGAAILYNTATLGILERARELATLRALGASLRSIAAQSTLELTIVGVFGIGVGLAAAEPLARRLVATFNSDLFTMPFVWSWPAGVCLGAALVALLLTAQIPALRTVARMNLATSVRSREG